MAFDDVAPWPEQTLPPRDHNQPPLEDRIRAEFREALLTERSDFDKLLDELLGIPASDDAPAVKGSVDRAYAKDEASLGKCGDLQNRLRACRKLVETTHRTLKAPYLEAGNAVDACKTGFFARIQAGEKKVQAITDAYAEEVRKAEAEARAKAEVERRKLEELARQNKLEAALPPPPPPPRPAPIRSDAGSAVSIGVEYVSKVTDYTKAFRRVKDVAAVREAVDKAIQALVKQSKGTIVIPGVEVTQRARTSAR